MKGEQLETKSQEPRAIMLVSPQEYFRGRGLSPRKRFGQHFLSQPGTAERIVEAGGLCPSDVVVEVGPGLGALTRFILPKVRQLHLVELDRDLAAFLEAHLPATEGRVFIYQQDILTFDFSNLARREGEPLVVLGNLPYNISSPLVFRLLEDRCCLKRAVLMVQKEVGERLTASPGGKELRRALGAARGLRAGAVAFCGWTGAVLPPARGGFPRGVNRVHGPHWA